MATAANIGQEYLYKIDQQRIVRKALEVAREQAIEKQVGSINASIEKQLATKEVRVPAPPAAGAIASRLRGEADDGAACRSFGAEPRGSQSGIASRCCPFRLLCAPPPRRRRRRSSCGSA